MSNTVSNVYISSDALAIWQSDIDDCDKCRSLPGDDVCSDHDLGDDGVALRYALAADDMGDEG
jgi:hypothetical protein